MFIFFSKLLHFVLNLWIPCNYAFCRSTWKNYVQLLRTGCKENELITTQGVLYQRYKTISARSQLRLWNSGRNESPCCYKACSVIQMWEKSAQVVKKNIPAFVLCRSTNNQSMGSSQEFKTLMWTWTQLWMITEIRIYATNLQLASTFCLTLNL